MKNLLLIAVYCICGLSIFSASAQQFSYKPVNPMFGGDTFNYQQLLSSATAQNGLTAPQAQQDELTDLERFGVNLNNQVLSQFARTLTQQQVEAIGDLTEPGSFTIGDLAIDVFESTEGLTINILNTSNGEETQIIVPN